MDYKLANKIEAVIQRMLGEALVKADEDRLRTGVAVAESIGNLVSERDFEIKVLRSLVDECRKILGSLNCGCAVEDGYECPRCYMTRTIDKGLAEIGENYNG